MQAGSSVVQTCQSSAAQQPHVAYKTFGPAIRRLCMVRCLAQMARHASADGTCSMTMCWSCESSSSMMLKDIPAYYLAQSWMKTPVTELQSVHSQLCSTIVG